MKNYFILLIAAASLVISGCQGKVTKSDLKTQKDKVSYSIGLDIGKNMKTQSIDIDPKAFLQGIKDGMSDSSVAHLLTDVEIQQVMMQFQKEMIAKQTAKLKATGEKNKIDGEKFLAANKNKPGVITLASGLQYKVIKSGSGKTPKASDKVTANYKGSLLDGTEFDNSYKRGEPATFPVSNIIKGWTEALLLMKEGDVWEVYLPANLAYGEQGAGQQIGPNAVLVFQIELLKVN
jgi:FKBP-type peptidyl-prolyl cis-trans isomerase